MKNIHVLPTDKPTRLFIADSKLFNYHKPQQGDGLKIINQNIYITSNEEIKEGDWVIDNDYDKSLVYKADRLFFEIGKEAKKIILTTDQNLIKDGVQAIDDEFLEWFVKDPSCEYVEVVYEPKNFLDTRQGWEYTIILKIPEEDWLLNNPHSKQIESCSKSLSKKCICPKEEPTIEEEYLKDELKKYDGIGVVVLNKPEEPKQETLEEAATKYLHSVADGKRYTGYADEDFINGAKWQADKVFNDDAIQTLEKALAILLKRQERMYNENEVELIANEMVNWAIDNVGNPNPQSGRKFDEVISKFKKK